MKKQIPCKECIALAMCRHKRVVECENFLGWLKEIAGQNLFGVYIMLKSNSIIRECFPSVHEIYVDTNGCISFWKRTPGFNSDRGIIKWKQQ